MDSAMDVPMSEDPFEYRLKCRRPFALQVLLDSLRPGIRHCLQCGGHALHRAPQEFAGKGRPLRVDCKIV